MTSALRPSMRVTTFLGLICLTVVFIAAFKFGQFSAVNIQARTRTTLAVSDDTPVRLHRIPICFGTHSLHPNSNAFLQTHSLENVEVLSWSPRVFLYKGFLTPEECDHIIELGTYHLLCIKFCIPLADTNALNRDQPLGKIDGSRQGRTPCGQPCKVQLRHIHVSVYERSRYHES